MKPLEAAGKGKATAEYCFHNMAIGIKKKKMLGSPGKQGDVRAENSGASVIELTIVALTAAILIGVLADFGLLFLAASRVVTAAREGARIASGTKDPEPIENDTRVTSPVVQLLPYPNGREIGVSAVIEPLNPVYDASNKNICNRAVNVSAKIEYQMFFAKMFGLNAVTLYHRVSMRYGDQGLCN